jgi:sterol 3beta-glucosyltransferase
MRMGTQALIQALQAMPWEEERDDDVPELASKRERGKGLLEPDSSDEDDAPTKAGKYFIWFRISGDSCPKPDFVLASSIHTIHRPVARSRLATPAFGGDLELPQRPFEPAEDYFSNPLSTDEDDGLRDFDEAATPDSGVPNPFKEPPRMKLQLPTEKMSKSDGKKRMPQPMRTASMATVRMKRRVKLADKLKDVFGIPEIQEVVAGQCLHLSLL